jgi:hypothetical protein
MHSALFRLSGPVLILACAGCLLPRVAPGNGHGSSPATGTGTCTVHEVAREQLLVDGGRALYVQPGAMEPNPRGDVLLAGDISFLLERGADGRWRYARKDSTFGALLSRDGTRHLILSPLPTRRIANVRAAARPDGRWDVVFGEVPQHAEPDPRAHSLIRLWHGVLDGSRWIHLDSLPLPQGGQLVSSHASNLLRRGDTLFLAVTFKRPDLFTDVAVFARRGQTWEPEVVLTRHDLYPRLAYSDSMGLVLVSVGGSGSRLGIGNSPVLWMRRGGWKPVGRIGTRGAEVVHDPWISLSPGAEVLSWEEEPDGESAGGWTARAVAHPLDPTSPVMMLDSSITPMFGSVRPVVVAPGIRLWVLDHAANGPGQKEIRIVRDSSGAVEVLSRTPNPYGTELNAAVPAPGTLLLSGGFEDREQGRPVSLLLRFQVACEAG